MSTNTGPRSAASLENFFNIYIYPGRCCSVGRGTDTGTGALRFNPSFSEIIFILNEEIFEKVDSKNKNNSSNSFVFGQWPQTKMDRMIYWVRPSFYVHVAKLYPVWRRPFQTNSGHQSQTKKSRYEFFLSSPPLWWIFYLLSSCYISLMRSKCTGRQYISLMNFNCVYKSWEEGLI